MRRMIAAAVEPSRSTVEGVHHHRAWAAFHACILVLLRAESNAIDDGGSMPFSAD